MNLRIACIGQRWWITMTACTVTRIYLDQTCMIWLNRRMDGLPTRVMTVIAVAARCKGLAIGAVSRYQGTGAGVMAVGTVGKMCRCIDKRICMTA